MAECLKELLKWFPSGTAEGERAILDQVFVYAEEFSEVLNPPPGNPHLLIGSKGSGKSAIIEFGLKIMEQQGIPAVIITPMDLDTSTIGSDSSTGDMARLFGHLLMSAVAGKLAETSSGWLDGDMAILHREAVQAGHLAPDFAGKMGRAFVALAKPLIQMDLAEVFPHLTKVTRGDLERALSRVINKKSFYIFIDDTDQIANPDRPGHLNRIWALMLEVRNMSSKYPEIKAVISLRSEVWQRLKTDPSGQRDQTDHFNSLCIQLKSDRAHIASIVERRLSLAANAIEHDGQLYEPFFEGAYARAPYSEDRRSWRDLIVVRSRERPRDAIQLVNELARRSLENRKIKIDEDQFIPRRAEADSRGGFPSG